MHLELPFTYPNYKLGLFIDKITLLLKQFNISIYSECFDDVMPFKKDAIVAAYSELKRAYMEKNSEEFTKFYKVDQMRLSDFLMYENEYDHAFKHYMSSGITVPKLLYYVDEQTLKVNSVIEWDGVKNILVPPFVDFIMYKFNNESKLVLAKEFNDCLKKFMDPIQSFLPGTKLISEKKMVKCQKAMNKYRFTMLLRKFKVVSQTTLID